VAGGVRRCCAAAENNRQSEHAHTEGQARSLEECGLTAASVRPEGHARGKRINHGMSRRNELQ